MKRRKADSEEDDFGLRLGAITLAQAAVRGVPEAEIYRHVNAAIRYYQAKAEEKRREARASLRTRRVVSLAEWKGVGGAH